jgi:aminoglycoside phosphotransferase (APT) family kinase protein
VNASASLVELLAARGLTPSSDRFVIGRPDRPTLAMTTASGAAVVVKQLPPDKAQRAFENMQALWKSSFGATRTPPGLPQPLDFFPEAGVIVMERIHGAPLAEGRSTEQDVVASIKLLAVLHESGVTFDSRRSSRGVIRSAQRKTAMLAELAPQHLGLANEVVAALETHRRKDTELLPSHGDFSPRNVLRGGDRLAIIDWERAQMADPARDVTYFATYPWIEDLKRGRWPSMRGVEHVIALYEAERPVARIEKQAPFHIAAGLLRRACSLVELWPEQSYLAPALLKAALRQFE